MSMLSLFAANMRGAQVAQVPQARPKKARKPVAAGPFTEAHPPELDSYVTIEPEQVAKGGPKSARAQAAASTPALVSAVSGGNATVVYVCELVLKHGFGGNPLKRLENVPFQRLRPYAGDEAAIARLRKLMLSAMRAAAASSATALRARTPVPDRGSRKRLRITAEPTTTKDGSIAPHVGTITDAPLLAERFDKNPGAEIAPQTAPIENAPCESDPYECPDCEEDEEDEEDEEAVKAFLETERLEEEAMEKFLSMQHRTTERLEDDAAAMVGGRRMADLRSWIRQTDSAKSGAAIDVDKTDEEKEEEIRAWVSGFKGQLGADKIAGVAEADQTLEHRNEEDQAAADGVQGSFDKPAGAARAAVDANADVDAYMSLEEREEAIRAWVRGFKGELESDKLRTECKAGGADVPPPGATDVPAQDATVPASDSPSTPSKRRTLRARKLRRKMSDAKEPWEAKRSRSRSPRSAALPTRRSSRLEMKEKSVAAVAEDQGLAGALAHALGSRKRMLLSELIIAVHGSDPRGSLREYQPKFLKIMEGIQHLEDSKKIYVADNIIFSLSE